MSNKQTAKNAAESVPSATPGELLFSLNAERVAEAIKAAGCAVTAVEHDGVVRLHSASQGIGFQVLWGNALSAGEYVDLTLSCPLRVEGGSLPEGVVTDWHRSKRFARVAQHGDFVVLEMDVLAAGGISPAHLDVMLQLWSQMMGQFFQHLRNFKPAASTSSDAGTESAQAVSASEPTAEALSA
ncbi:MAG: YbjN domain-containing protein [Acidovorax sp.]|jgi:hypothetical protein|nr:YbjN domain-containing protein [Acidovorax sp.]MDR3005986.1 YbjN domain-containing protein [Acidovorax sp.]